MTTTSSLASTALAVPPPVARPVCTSVLLTSCLLGRVSLDLRAVRAAVAPGGSLVGGSPASGASRGPGWTGRHRPRRDHAARAAAIDEHVERALALNHRHEGVNLGGRAIGSETELHRRHRHGGGRLRVVPEAKLADEAHDRLPHRPRIERLRARGPRRQRGGERRLHLVHAHGLLGHGRADARTPRAGATGPVCEGCRVPWVPELFSAPVLERWQEERREERLSAVPYFDGLLAGDLDALVGSFAREPEVHHPVRGRIKGARAFADHVAETTAWLRERDVSIETVERVVTEEHGFEEVILHLDGETGRVGLPLALVADHPSGAQRDEVRIYFSTWPLTGRHANRPPLLQRDPELRESDVVGEYQRALAAGARAAAVAAFEPDGYAREPAGGGHVHRGRDGLRAFYGHLFSGGGGIPLEHCAVVDDGRACALEYNVVRWGETDLPPEAGVAVHVRGASGRLPPARISHATGPPLGPRASTPPPPPRAAVVPAAPRRAAHEHECRRRERECDRHARERGRQRGRVGQRPDR